MLQLNPQKPGTPAWEIKPSGPGNAHTIYGEKGKVLGHISFDRQTAATNKWLVQFHATPAMDHDCFTLDAAVGYVRGIERALTASTDMVKTLVGTIRAVVAALHCPRNRFGKLEPALADRNGYTILQPLAHAAGLPHGGADIVDQACMILQAAIGEKPTPIDELKNVDMAGRRK